MRTPHYLIQARTSNDPTGGHQHIRKDAGRYGTGPGTRSMHPGTGDQANRCFLSQKEPEEWEYSDDCLLHTIMTTSIMIRLRLIP